ncbi:MAG TPA: class I SAM-dependent methyltransferase [Vicinamibacterales bacterium]|nr:class I SAM-dependent methyltransferase [Vicinamibacterales bacterium]
MTERLDDTLRRLQKERDEADRRYNDALTALDQARPAFDPLPRPVAGHDEHQLGALNEAWNIVPGPPAGGGVKARVAGIIWRAVAPYFQRQLSFNSLLVDHLNRTTEAARQARRASEERAAALEARFAAIDGFTARLMLYLQQITAYVDTKDRETSGGALVLNAAISGMAENLDKRWESLDVRLETRTAALTSSYESLKGTQEAVRTAVSVSQQASLSLKRELERLMATRPDMAGAEPEPPVTAARTEAFAPALDAFKYVGFEDRFRGPRELIRQRLESYVPMFEGARDVLDVGCGRGEFLELLAGAGISGRGIDLNHEMAELCRARGLDVTEADAVTYLSGLPDASLGGLFAAQVVEHLQPAYLLRFLELAFHKIRPGGRIVLETLNPACWVAFFDSYIRDITHVWPLHPDTLEYLVLASGFPGADVEYRSPVPERDKLQILEVPEGADGTLVELAETLNANVRLLNRRMFTYLDYAVVGTR